SAHREFNFDWRPRDGSKVSVGMFFPYLGDIERMFGGWGDVSGSEEHFVAMGYSRLKRALFISDGVAIDDPLTPFLHTVRESVFFDHPEFLSKHPDWESRSSELIAMRATRLTNLVRRLYELVPGISDGVIELVQPEFCYL